MPRRLKRQQQTQRQQHRRVGESMADILAGSPRQHRGTSHFSMRRLWLCSRLQANQIRAVGRTP